MNARPTLRLEFRDTIAQRRNPYDHFAVKSISKWCDVIVEEPGEICIFSRFGTSHLDFKGPKIQITAENDRPDFTDADFAIGYDRLQDDRYLRFPFWAWRGTAPWLLKSSAERVPEPGAKFCAFVYSNPRPEKRKELFAALHKRRFVESPGSVLHNTDAEITERTDSDWRDGKIDYLRQFQFVIAAENGRHRGYVTEKIVDVFEAGAIPIYWGDPTVKRDFNPESFVNADDFATWDELAEHVVALSEDRGAMQRMREAVPMNEKAWRRNTNPRKVERFLHRAVTSLVPRLANVPLPPEV